MDQQQFTIRAEVSKTRISRILPLNEILIPLIQQLNQHHLENHWIAMFPFLPTKIKPRLTGFHGVEGW
jgi:hypothetical protein